MSPHADATCLSVDGWCLMELKHWPLQWGVMTSMTLLVAPIILVGVSFVYPSSPSPAKEKPHSSHLSSEKLKQDNELSPLEPPEGLTVKWCLLHLYDFQKPGYLVRNGTPPAICMCLIFSIIRNQRQE